MRTESTSAAQCDALKRGAKSAISAEGFCKAAAFGMQTIKSSLLLTTPSSAAE
jgi:hypothetical protein